MTIPEKFVKAETMLHEMATSETGLTDFGDSYLPGLRVLLNALDADLKLTAVHRQRVLAMLVNILIARLYTQKGWSECAECLETEIHEPLIIIGIPRTGTTPLLKMLALDPQFQALEYWLTQGPMMRPPREQWESNPLYQRVSAALKAMEAETPLSMAIHEMAAGEADECLNVLVQNFVSVMFVSCFSVRTYQQWWLTQDETPSYRRHANVLKLIGFAEREKRWLLKNPSHILAIEPLLKVFPDARIVHTHRNPVKAVPSCCSLVMMARRSYLGREANPHELGRQQSLLWSIGVNRTIKAREQQPQNFYDVEFGDFVENPIGVVRGIYRHFGLSLEDEVEEAMNNWLANHSKTKPGFHRYTPQDFGLTEKMIREQYEDYMGRYYPN